MQLRQNLYCDSFYFSDFYFQFIVARAFVIYLPHLNATFRFLVLLSPSLLLALFSRERKEIFKFLHCQTGDDFAPIFRIRHSMMNKEPIALTIFQQRKKSCSHHSRSLREEQQILLVASHTPFHSSSDHDELSMAKRLQIIAIIWKVFVSLHKKNEVAIATATATTATATATAVAVRAKKKEKKFQ